MKIETILNAMGATYYSVSWPANLWDDEVSPDNILKSRRQYRAFRERILRVDAEKDEEHELTKLRFDLEVAENMGLKQQIAELTADLDIAKGRVTRYPSIDEAIESLESDQ